MKTDTIHERMRREIAEKKIFEQVKTHAFSYMDTVLGRDVVPSEKAVQELAVFDEPLPGTPQRAQDVLDQLHRYGSPATVAQTGGRYFGFVNGNVIPTGLAARWLSDTWDQNAALHVISPIAAKLEQVCERWLIELLNLPSGTAAGFVGGTSVATLCGLAAARYALLDRLDWDVSAKGLSGAPKLRIVLSEQSHGTVFKALALLGFGKDDFEIVPADAQGRINVSQLPGPDSQTLLILQAGNVNTGAFDAFDPICDKANKAGTWVHIDGAFGLWAEASENKRHLTQGIEKADSWSVDGHKTLNTPYDCGIILCKHRDALVACQTPAQTQATLDHVQRSGVCWCGGTLWAGEPAIRISVCSWATTSADVEKCAAAFIQARDNV